MFHLVFLQKENYKAELPENFKEKSQTRIFQSENTLNIQNIKNSTEY